MQRACPSVMGCRDQGWTSQGPAPSKPGAQPIRPGSGAPPVIAAGCTYGMGSFAMPAGRTLPVHVSRACPCESRSRARRESFRLLPKCPKGEGGLSCMADHSQRPTGKPRDTEG